MTPTHESESLSYNVFNTRSTQRDSTITETLIKYILQYKPTYYVEQRYARVITYVLTNIQNIISILGNVRPYLHINKNITAIT